MNTADGQLELQGQSATWARACLWRVVGHCHNQAGCCASLTATWLATRQTSGIQRRNI